MAARTRPARIVRQLRTWLLLVAVLSTLLVALPAAAMQAAADAPAETPPTQAPAATVAAPPETDVRGRFESTFDLVLAKLAALVAKLPLLLAALLIVMFSAWLGGFLSRHLHLVRLRTQNPYMNGLIRNAMRALITLFGVLLALELLNATALVTAVLGSAGVVGLVFGFAFKDIAENYIAGLLLSLRQPFSPGDHVVIDGNEGKVVALHSRSTMLMTLDGNELRLPNALVFKAILLNYTRNPKRRFDFNIMIDATQSIRNAQSLAIDRISRIDGVLADPGPSWIVHDYTPAGVALRFFGWVDQGESDPGKVRSEAIRLVKAAFAQAGIEAPRTVYHVMTARGPSESTPPAPAEPAHSIDADTSVNRDIDEQLARAQHAADDGANLLETRSKAP